MNLKLQCASRGILCAGLLSLGAFAQEPAAPPAKAAPPPAPPAAPPVPAARPVPPPPPGGEAMRPAAIQTLNAAYKKSIELRMKLSKDNAEIAAIQAKKDDVDKQMRELGLQRDALDKQITDILCRDPEFKAVQDQIQAARQQLEEFGRPDPAQRRDDPRGGRGEGAPRPDSLKKTEPAPAAPPAAM